MSILLFKFLIAGSSLMFNDNRFSIDKAGLLRSSLLIISKLKRSSLVLFSVQDSYHKFSKLNSLESDLSIDIIYHNI